MLKLKYRPTFLWFFCLTTAIYSNVLLAKSNDGDQPIHIEADVVILNDETNISIYKGHVKMVQGSMLIQANTLIITLGNKNKIDSMQMTGSPATFFQINDAGEDIYGEGKNIHYLEPLNRLTLKNDALLRTRKDVFRSNYIEIDTKNDTVLAGQKPNTQKPNTQKDRVRITIQPQEKNNDKTTTTTQ